MATQLGKRYLCESCGVEVLCNKGGGGELTCCDTEMKLKGFTPAVIFTVFKHCKQQLSN
jgi:hypothetical protein